MTAGQISRLNLHVHWKLFLRTCCEIVTCCVDVSLKTSTKYSGPAFCRTFYLLYIIFPFAHSLYFSPLSFGRFWTSGTSPGWHTCGDHSGYEAAPYGQAFWWSCLYYGECLVHHASGGVGLLMERLGSISSPFMKATALYKGPRNIGHYTVTLKLFAALLFLSLIKRRSEIWQDAQGIFLDDPWMEIPEWCEMLHISHSVLAVFPQWSSAPLGWMCGKRGLWFCSFVRLIIHQINLSLAPLRAS